MKNYFYTLTLSTVGITILAASFNCSLYGNEQKLLKSTKAIYQLDSLTTARFLQRAALAGMKEVLIGEIAANKAVGKKVKAFGQMMVAEHIKANEELRALAKLKKVDLPMSTPEGGQRPDGRVDSSPENLRDTSRNKNTGGEAGNTGQSKTDNGVNEADVNTAKEKLIGLSGIVFDKAYIEMMVSDHQMAVALFEKAAQSNDGAVKAYASKYLPVLKKHLKQIKALAKN
ncbi:DUF4142 domain-containing protein [Pedobacter psychrodurus]|uniref:DUF4142 domain-containing protein n=1 Tax=Pedobacter psychrodurus TaxID=2530456 RepID=A0A4R0PWF6_9SPHI|nr:DUF4142 domain-containing protein [Pedobacter psychrodurus]TCD27043.1 DUF4142 domain-containing protein [Pedobacter psychrodurus]